jgi:hypothetical protein
MAKGDPTTTVAGSSTYTVEYRQAARISDPVWCPACKSMGFIQKISETYGWRDTQEKQFLDAGDLRGAVDSNFDAIKPYMLEEGFTGADLEATRTRLHEINEEQGWY